MSSPAVLLLPAGSAFGFVLSAIFIKKSIRSGCSQAALNLVVNLLPAIAFQLLWLGAGSPDWHQAWKPVVTGFTFLLGQIFTLLAWRNGEVSVTTPLLGTKVVFTAVFSALIFGQLLAVQWWLGAVACSVGVLLVTGATLGSLLPRLLRLDALFSLGAASTFALTDVLVQRWTPDLGVPAFVAVMFGVTGVASIGIFAPQMARGKREIPAAAAPALAVGAVLYSVQILGMAVALGLHESATAVNVVYGSRAVWSVLLTWLLARLLVTDEMRDPPRVMLRRLAGAFLVFAAVLAVLIG